MKTKNKKVAILSGIVMLMVIGIIVSVSAQDPYGLSGHIYDKNSTAIVGANITFNNTNTNEQIYFDSAAGGEYAQDAYNFPSHYTDGDVIEYTVTYDGNVSWNRTTAPINTSAGGGTTLDIYLDQRPASPSGQTDLGMNLIDHTPTITWTKGTDADGDTVTTYVYVGTGASPTTVETSVTAETADLGSTVTLTDGTTYYYRLRSWDGERWSTDYTADDTFRMNSVPTVGTVNITPATAYTNSALTGDGTYADSEDDAESGSTYKWFKDDAEIGGETTTSLANTHFVRGDAIIFQYTPNDGYETGTPVNSSAKTIANSLPTVPTTLTLNTTIYMGDVLAGAGSGSTDTDTGDGDILTYYYEFKEGVNELQAYSTTNTYTITSSEAHDTITVNCKVYDGITYSSVKTETKDVSDTKPTTPTGSSIAGTTKLVGDTLTVTGAGSTDVDGAVTYQYEFRRGSVSGTIVKALSDSNEYTLVTGDAHDTIYVLVYGREHSTNSDAYEAEDRVVTNSVPVLASIGAKNVDDKVQVTVDEDATDGDDDTRTYSCNRTDLFSDFSTSTGLGHWTPFYNQTGVYYVDFGVSDGYGGTDNETITITITDVTFNTSLSSGYQILAYIGESNGTAEIFGDSTGVGWDYAVNRSASGTYYSHANNSGINNFITEKGRGYFVSTSATSPFARSRIDDVGYTTNLKSGWEVVGWTNITSVNANTMESDIGAECTFSTEKNMTTGTYKTHQHGFGINNYDVDIGVGYFVFVSDNVDWVRQQ